MPDPKTDNGKGPYSWIWFCLVFQVFSIIGFAFFVDASSDARAAYVIFLATAVLLFSTFPYGMDARITYRLAFTTFLSNTVLFILVCATVYYSSGLVAGSAGLIAVSWQTAIYFSIVTFTTLGYGDFQPPPSLRLMAAFEAIMGYLVLGFFIGLTDDFLRNDRKTSATYGLGGEFKGAGAKLQEWVSRARQFLRKKSATDDTDESENGTDDGKDGGA